MVMDENGRNGWKWRLAQQITYPVMPSTFYQFTQLTYHAIINDNIPTTIHTTCNSIITQIWGNFYFSYKYPYPIIIIYNLLTNRLVEYGIIAIRFRWI